MTSSSGRSSLVDLRPYPCFKGSLPAVAGATEQELVQAVIAIVDVEGPVVGSRIHAVYGRCAGHKMGSKLAEKLTKAISKAVQAKLLIRSPSRAKTPDATFRLPDQPVIRHRVLGQRALGEVPRDERADVMRMVASQLGWANNEAVLRATMTEFGINRMGSHVRTSLQSVVGRAQELASNTPRDRPNPEPSARNGRSGAWTPISGSSLALKITRTTGAADLDVSVFLLGPDDRVRSDVDFVFYNQPSTPDGTVRLIGGVSSEQVTTPEALEIDLDGLAFDVHGIVVAVSVDEGTLSDVDDVTLSSSGSGGAAIEIVADRCPNSALIFAEISRRDDGWSIRSRHRPCRGGLAGLAEELGIEVEG